MALIKKCDRCGKSYKHTLMSGIQFTAFNGVFHQRRYYDLCHDCTKTLSRWLKLKDELEVVDV